MKGKTLTKAETDLHDELRNIGCCVCRFVYRTDMDDGNVESITAIHHIEGKTKPNAHYLVIPLCQYHHQYGTESNPSIHAYSGSGGKAQFKRVHGYDEYELMEMTEAYLDRPYSSENEESEKGVLIA